MNPESHSAPGASDPCAAGAADLFAGAQRSAERIDKVLDLVRREWLENPDERFFQLVPNLAGRLGVTRFASVLEDDALIGMLEQRQAPGSD